MWPYVLLVLSPVLIQHVRIKNVSSGKARNEKKYMAMKFFWGLLLVFLILRHIDVGRDLENYRRIFNTISKRDWQEALWRSSEFGYNFVNKIISVFTDNFQWIVVVTAVLSVLFIYRTYLSQAEDTALTVALYVNMSNFVFLFSGLRQSIAISLGFLAFEFVRKKKLVYYLIIVILAMLFHTSAFILLFMYPIYHMKITKSQLLFIIPILCTIMVFNRRIFGTLTMILSMFTEYEAEIVTTGAYTMLILFAIFAVFSYLIPEESFLDSDTIGLRNFLLFSVALQMFAPLHTIAMRMNYYYIAFIPLLIPKIIKYRSVRWSKIAVFARNVMVIFFVIYFFISAPRDNVLDTFPYKFFWS